MNEPHVTVELSPALAAAVVQDDVESRTAAALGDLAASLGLAPKIAVEQTVGRSERAVRILVVGELRPFSPELMARVWIAVAPDALAALPQMHTGGGFGDSWLDGYTARTGAGERPALAEYLAQLAAAAIADRPSVLLRTELTPELAACGRLLDLGVSLRRLDTELVQLHAFGELGVPPEDAIEILFEERRPQRLEIRLNPAVLERLTSKTPTEPASVYEVDFDEDLGESFRFLEEGLFAELGIVLPDLVVVPTSELPDGTIALRINDRSEPPLQIPGEHEVFVAARLGSVQALGVEHVRAAENPAGGHGSCAPAEAASVLTDAGLSYWTPAQFVVLAAASEIRRRAECLLGVEDVEARLGTLATTAPQLVEATGTRFSAEELTRVIRLLVAERISVRNLRTILERALEAGDEDCASAEVLAEFLRAGMRDAVGNRFTWGESDTLVAYLLDPSLEADPDPERVRGAVWRELEELPDDVSRPVLLVPAAVRPTIRKAVADELPTLGVVSYDDLRASVNVQPVARIGTDV